MSQHFLSCDWGTSTFRLHLVERKAGRVLATHSRPQGILATFRAWQERPENEKQLSRVDYFSRWLQRRVLALESAASLPADALPIVLSGMASSSVGMRELPYAALPLPLDGSRLVTERIPPSPPLPHMVVLISGARLPGDVMRGEEVQAIGWRQLDRVGAAEGILVLPGTHSKHLYVSGNRLTHFKTFMTGELFELLSRYSILKDSLQPPLPYHLWSPKQTERFREGIRAAVRDKLTHSLFTIRARQLAGDLPSGDASCFLSGLLIGQEVKQLKNMSDELPIIFCADHTFRPLYRLASDTLAFHKDTRFIPSEQVELLTVFGQRAILEKIGL